MIDDSKEIQSKQFSNEIKAAERELPEFVESFSQSKVLPQGPTHFYVNLRTLEGQTVCIELTVQGWRIVSQRFDSTNEDKLDASLPTRHFETMQQLLSTISGRYRDQFGSSLGKALIDLQKAQANK